MSMIKVNNLSFRYDTNPNYIFEDVSFVIDTNWKLGFIGRNGKGKTWIFAYPKSAMLKAKVKSLEGYVTMNASLDEIVKKIEEYENQIGTKI